jgi:hypothetical protein
MGRVAIQSREILLSKGENLCYAKQGSIGSRGKNCCSKTGSIVIQR